MQEAPPVEFAERHALDGRSHSGAGGVNSTTSIRALVRSVVLHRRMAGSIVGGLLAACFLYCLIAPNQYEATARVALRTSAGSSLSLDGPEPVVSASVLSAPMQLETLAGVLRSDRLAWKVIIHKKLYLSSAFRGRFAARYPEFRPDAPGTDAEEYLLDRFQDRLRVSTLPRSLLVEIRFRSRDARVSAEVVNALIAAYGEQQGELRMQATDEAAGRLQTQLNELKARADGDDRKLAAFQKKHGILISSETLANGRPATAAHLPAMVELDELGREQAAANSERILREAEYRAAAQGDPEVVLAFDPRVQGEGASLSNSFRQIHARRSDLEQELAQLSIERGPNFPRVLEIRQQLKDLDKQLETEKAKLRERFRDAWVAAEDHEQLVRVNLAKRTGEGRRVNDAVTTYEGMRRQADATRDLYLRMQDKVEEASLAAGTHEPDIWVVDEARSPAKPVAPNLPLYLAVTLFVALWIAVGGALLIESIHPSSVRAGLILMAVLLAGAEARAQAPTPSTQGIPTGVVKLPPTTDNKSKPNPKEAPPVWSGREGNGEGPATPDTSSASSPIAAPIAPGFVLDVSEFHTPEFRSTVRVSSAGTVKLPMVDEVRVDGMDEMEAARAISSALVAGGILNHPQVTVLITAFVGQDVSVLGEVTRPGIYPYAYHHRLLDMISAASGLTAMAGAVVNIYHRSDPNTPNLVPLDPNGAAGPDHNPELTPGDIVEVTRAGLVYVVGDVIRPGGFTVDPTQELTVLRALSLAWGPSQNAALGSAILIREQKDGRTVTNLDLKRMLRGEDPDHPIHDRDILFVPNSMAKSLFNRTVEAAIQSAVGVSIYAGLVYSQRF
ncbi:MAG TPA: polysaccharide biosynthesis/export family protein [Terracidiphilus sp.]|nr:polysaccharide biosynthesis/export family protein [Terracidiphilus sp.]